MFQNGKPAFAERIALRTPVPLLLLAFALLAGRSPAFAAAIAYEQRFTQWIHDGLLDSDVPLEKRQKIAAEIEAFTADDTHPDALYLLGSLYHQDPGRSSSPLPQNLDRARELLSRAALHGTILAMAKLSTIELEAGNRFEANVWSQLYCHYDKDAESPTVNLETGLAASILRNALVGLAESEIDALDRSVGNMIDRYDAQIRAGLARPAVPLEDSRKARKFKAHLGRQTLKLRRAANGRIFETGMAEFVVELDSDGSIRQLQILDSWPNPHLAKALSDNAATFRVDAGEADEMPSKAQLLRIVFDDGRYGLRDPANSD